MVSDEPLFAGFDPPDPPTEPPLTAQRRLTLRQKADVAAGVHPLTHTPLHPSASRDAVPGQSGPFTCGACVFRAPGGPHDYPKCLLPGPDGHPIRARLSHSATTDVRGWWPACGDYQPR